MTVEAFDVVVVGAGIAGIAVASGLFAAGRTVRVLEARGRVGGRMETEAVHGGYADMGPTWFWPGEQRVAQLVNQLDVQVYAQWNSGNALMMTNGTSDRLGYQSPPAYRFVRGAAHLVERLAQTLPDDVVQLNAGVRFLEQEGEGVLVSLEDTTISAAAAVVALPPALAMSTGLVAADSLEPHVAQVAGNIPTWMGGITKAVAVYPEPFWRDQGLSGMASCPSSPFGEIHDMSGPEGQPAMLFGFGTSNPQAGPLTGDQFVEQLQVLFGPLAASPTQLMVRDWQQDRLTTPHHWPLSRRYELFGAPQLQDPSWDGRLFWSSTETATTAPGHIEGALQAAERTVKQLT